MFDFGGLERNIISSLAQPTGIREFTHKEPATDGTDFVRFVKDTACIAVDKVMLSLTRNEFDRLEHMTLALGWEDVPRDEKEKRKFWTSESALNVITLYNMMQVGAVMERSLLDSFWHGNLGIKSGIHEIESVRECSRDDLASLVSDIKDKQNKQCESIIVTAPDIALLLNMPFSEEGRSFVVDFAIDDSNVYILPIRVGDEPMMVEHYVDYRRYRGNEINIDESWWSDSGMFAWQQLTDKWDYKLKLTTKRKAKLNALEFAYLIRVEE